MKTLIVPYLSGVPPYWSGIDFYNHGEKPAVVIFKQIESGESIMEDTISIPAYGHFSFLAGRKTISLMAIVPDEVFLTAFQGTTFLNGDKTISAVPIYDGSQLKN